MDRPQLDSSVEAHRLVARFLRSHGYTATLDSFLADATSNHPRLPSLLDRTGAAGQDAGHDLQDVVDDWVSSRLARLKVDDPLETLRDQLDQCELVEQEVPKGEVQTGVRDATNILTVTRGTLPRREWDTQESRYRSYDTSCIFTTAVDRTLKIWSSSSFELLETHTLPSPSLSTTQHPSPELARFVVCSTMEGSLVVLDLVTREVKTQLKDHTKYIVRTAWSPDGRYIATIGYDKHIHIYRFDLSDCSSSSSEAPTALDDEEPDPLATCPDVTLTKAHTVTARTNPEAAVWLPDSQWLVWSAREDHLLHYLRAPADSAAAGADDAAVWEEQTINMNENGDSFVSFSVLFITLHPTLPLLSLQTNTPSARILLYPFHSSTRLLTLHTTASQSDYFAPRHAWLPSGSAVAVNSEDGALRLVDLRGRVRLLAGAHGAAAPPDEDEVALDAQLRSERARLRREKDKGSSVIRDVEVLGGDEDAQGRRTPWRIVSCGFDKTVKVLGGGAV
ncbi:hypothetical protein Rhopal_003787-T1 [Rhodotorula paludigena]|uniref:LisH domain-containing protein n=1 Tax=Rhodotorula paludigena TaxID=86838 RepID=A0AAV5GQ23_9BASI|nr:hypothetical protein Rhopal_003787-T1 [Rhodotorula paludigena]